MNNNLVTIGVVAIILYVATRQKNGSPTNGNGNGGSNGNGLPKPNQDKEPNVGFRKKKARGVSQPFVSA